MHRRRDLWQELCSYDNLFLEGWIAHAKNANTYSMRANILADIEREFPNKISTKEINRYLQIYNL